MKKKSVFLTVLLASMVLLLAACGRSEDVQSGTVDGEKTYNFRLSLVTPPTHGWTVTAEKFNEELQNRSEGRMSVEIFPSGQLGTEADMVQLMEVGTLDFGFITNAYMSTRSESLNAWFMPFLFEDLAAASQARNSEEAKQMLAELDVQGLVGLDFSFAGERHVLMKDGAIHSPEDLNGKKLRIIGNPVMQDFWTGLGVSPTPMPLGEVYSSLQTGVIDGIDIDLDALVSMNLQEIAQDLTLTKQMAFPSVVVMSKQVFESLSAEDQAIVVDAMQAAVDWGVEDAIERENSNLEVLKDKGLTIIDDFDTSAFASIKEEIYSKYSSNDIIKSFIENNQ
ncbi:TRAP transporter substrate-binding protein [Anaerobacillus sp. MEB173]|uniref:TRAP transporter substrate-binding protein n=1 Tax=Anaerobacillus sp. MEB173 TaxID=3383345 RepID=UPI003F8EF42A